MKHFFSKAAIKHFFSIILKGRNNYYSCFLPANIGLFAGKVLRSFFSKVRLNNEQTENIKEIGKNAYVVYASKYKSRFEFMFYYSRYQQESMPFPEIGLDYKIFLWQPVSRFIRIIFSHIDFLMQKWHFSNPYDTHYIRDEILNNRTCFLSLVEEKGFYRRFVKAKTDPIRYLIEIQQNIEKPIYIVPQWLLFSKKAAKSQRSLTDIIFGTEENPGAIRRFITTFRHPSKVFVEIAEPFNLQQFLRLPENQNRNADHLAYLVRHLLIDRINRYRQSIVGPVLKSREELKEIILRSEPIRNFMNEYAESRKMTNRSVYKKAEEYLDEIASNYNFSIIQIYSWAITWICNNMFEGFSYNRDGISKIRQASQKGPIIFAPCHKSHIDYLILSYVLYHNNMPCPLIAAGKNLSFWPMGPIFRGGGAFFLRRTFKGALLYSTVFEEYVKTVIREGFNMEFFIEGGRSRTGKLNFAKLGLLSMILDAYKDGYCPDLYFVPTYIGYDQIIEENSYLSELEGKTKEPESLSQMISARKFLKKRFGRIYVQFNDPISLKDVLDNFDKPLNEMNPKEAGVFCRNIGHRIINGINEVSVVTPHTLVASALLNSPIHGFMKSEAASRMETYLTYLDYKKARLSDTLSNYVHSVEHAIESYLHRKIIEKLDVSSVREALGDTRLMVTTSKRSYLDFYKNNCVSFFIPPSYSALSIISYDAFQFTEEQLYPQYEFLQEFFKNEFTYDVDKYIEEYISETLKGFINDAIIMPHPELRNTYNVTSVGFRKLGYFAAFVKTYFESYWVVLNVFMENERESLEEEKDREKKFMNMGYRMYKNKEIERYEAISKITFINAAKYFTDHGIKGRENKTEIDHYSQKIQNYLKHLKAEQ